MLQQLNEDGCPVGRSTPRLKILNMWGTLCADYWAIISELQTHASNFVCGIGTEALKITFLLCQLFLYSFCQYGVPEGRCVAGGERMEEGHQTCFSCLLPFLKVSPQQWFFTHLSWFVFGNWFWFLTFPQHTPSEASSSAGDCPLLKSPALWISILNLYSLFPHP